MYAGNRIRGLQPDYLGEAVHIYPFRGHSTGDKHLRKILEFTLAQCDTGKDNS